MKNRLISACSVMVLLLSLLVVPMAVSAESAVDAALAGLTVQETLFNGAGGFTKDAILSMDAIFEYSQGKGVNGRDDDCALRYVENGSGGEGSFVIAVKDTMRVELAILYNVDQVGATSYTYAASADGETFTEITAESIITESFENSTLGAANRVVISALPAGTTQLKVTIDSAVWWQPAIDYVKLYDVASEDDSVKVAPYLAGTTVAESVLWMSADESQWSTLDSNSEDEENHVVLDYDNWSFGKKHENGGQYGYDDRWSIQRGSEKDAYIVLAVDDEMLIEVGTQAHESWADVITNTFFASADGETWTQLECVTERRTREQDEKLAPSYVGIFDVVTALPEGTTQVKIVTSSGNAENSWWTPLMDYINLRRVVDLDYLAADLEGYEVVTHIGFTDQGDALNLLASHENWNSGNQGVTYEDSWSAQRKNGVWDDATMILNVDGSTSPKVQVATVIGEGLYSVTTNTYYTSADGETWTKVEDVLTVDMTHADNEKAPEGWVVRVEQLNSIPYDATQLKIVTSTNNTPESWWSPLIDYIDLYAPVAEQEAPSLKLKDENDSAMIMITDGFVIADLNGKTMTVAELTDKFDLGDYTLVWFDEDGNVVADGKTLIASGMQLKMMDGETVLVESSLTVMNAGEATEDESSSDAEDESSSNTEDKEDITSPDTGVDSLTLILLPVAVLAGAAVVVLSKKKLFA